LGGKENREITRGYQNHHRGKKKKNPWGGRGKLLGGGGKVATRSFKGGGLGRGNSGELHRGERGGRYGDECQGG